MPSLRGVLALPYNESTQVGMRHTQGSQTAVSRPIAMAGSGVQDERLNDPDGFREGGTVFATAMDDLNP